MPSTRQTTVSRARAGLVGLGAATLAALLTVGMPTGSLAETAYIIPAPAMDAPASARTEKAVFAGGCFWGVQGVFQHVRGVRNAVSGYAGGSADTAVYETVGSGRTGHAEAVEITFDPKVVSYGKLLQIYFSVAHNPTELNRQGPDSGTQYRSTIFASNTEQKKVAAAYIAQLDKADAYDGKIATTIETGQPFYAAEDYHQDYATLHPDSGYIATFDLPKIENVKKVFPDLYRSDPVLVAEAGVVN